MSCYNPNPNCNCRQCRGTTSNTQIQFADKKSKLENGDEVIVKDAHARNHPIAKRNEIFVVSDHLGKNQVVCRNARVPSGFSSPEEELKLAPWPHNQKK